MGREINKQRSLNSEIKSPEVERTTWEIERDYPVYDWEVSRNQTSYFADLYGNVVIAVEWIEERRTGLSKNPFYIQKYMKDTRRDLNSILRDVKSIVGDQKFSESFEIHENQVVSADFEDSTVVETLYQLMHNDYLGIGLRYAKIDDRVAFSPDPLADPQISLEEAKSVIEEAARITSEQIEIEVDLEHNYDWWTDYFIHGWTSKKDTENIKEKRGKHCRRSEKRLSDNACWRQERRCFYRRKRYKYGSGSNRGS